MGEQYSKPKIPITFNILRRLVALSFDIWCQKFDYSAAMSNAFLRWARSQLQHQIFWPCSSPYLQRHPLRAEFGSHQLHHPYPSRTLHRPFLQGVSSQRCYPSWSICLLAGLKQPFCYHRQRCKALTFKFVAWKLTNHYHQTTSQLWQLFSMMVILHKYYFARARYRKCPARAIECGSPWVSVGAYEVVTSVATTPRVT
jgi:hypothetical protein